MLRVLKILLMLVVLLVGAGFAAIWYVGAWNILFPSNAHDSVAPPLPVTLGSPAILVFSKTNQFRHKDGIAGGHVALGEIDRGELHPKRVFNLTAAEPAARTIGTN